MKLFKTKMLHVAVLILASSIGVVSMSIASAADLSSKDESCQVLSDLGGNCGAESDKDISGAIKTAIQVLLIVAGIIAVIMIIVGGLKYVTSSGDPQAISSAKKTIIYAIIGLVVVIFAQLIVQFVLSRSSNGGDVSSQLGSVQVDLDKAADELLIQQELLQEASDAEKDRLEREYRQAQEAYEDLLREQARLERRAAELSRSGSSRSGDGATTQVKVCYAVPIQDKTKVEPRMLHKYRENSQYSDPRVTTYAMENSPAGIRYAASAGYRSVDIDVNVTKDGVAVASHFNDLSVEGFGKGKISDRNYKDIDQLKSRDGHKIYTVEQVIKLLADNNLNMSLEVKASRVVGQLPKITTALNKYKVKAIVKADADLRHLDTALSKARDYGFWTRGTQGSDAWAKPTPRCG